MGVEPMNNGFAGRRVSHFATRAVNLLRIKQNPLHSGSGFEEIGRAEFVVYFPMPEPARMQHMLAQQAIMVIGKFM